MSRRSRSSEETFTLFPFLAVLLCTMGTLTMIFVAVAQKGSAAPERETAAERVDFDPAAGLGDGSQYGAIVDSQTLANSLNRNKLGRRSSGVSALEELDESDADVPSQNPLDAEYERARKFVGNIELDDVVGERESVEWFLDELRSVRKRTEASLDEQRARLANAESALARLRAEQDVLKKKYDALSAESVASPDEDAVALQDKINALDDEIEKLRREADELRREGQKGKRSYAIVPYQGKKGTFRRPIFVECTSRGVFLQPEGMRFNDDDFMLASFPGNPFDSALRAASRHYLDTEGEKTASGEKVEPYPLLVVRPGGEKYFYVAQAALASWGDVFGYEFVDEGQEIQYPEPDPVLLQTAIEQTAAARKRLAAQLAEARALQNAAIRQLGFSGPSSGRSGDAPKSALQSQLGSNVKLGAAKVGGGNGGAASGPGRFDGAGRHGSAPTAADGIAMLSGQKDIKDISAPSFEATPAYNGAFAKYVTKNPTPDDPEDASASDPFEALLTGAPEPAASGGTAPSSNNPFAQSGGSENASASDSFKDLLIGAPEPSEPVGTAPSYNGSFAQSGAQNSASGGSENGLFGGLMNAPPQFAQGAGGTSPLSTSGSALGSAFPSAGQNAPASSGASGYDAANSAYAQTGDQLQYVPTTGASENAADTPRYMERLVAPQEGGAGESGPVSARETLGNTAYSAGASGTATDGTADGDRFVTEEEPAPKRDDNYPEAFRLSQITPTNSAIERGVLARCEANAIVFPKQPGVRAATTVACDASTDPERREKELLDAVLFCIKSWGLAGRNAYWAPFVKAEVAEGGEERFRELSEFCERQGLSVVSVKTKAPAK